MQLSSRLRPSSSLLSLTSSLSNLRPLRLRQLRLRLFRLRPLRLRPFRLRPLRLRPFRLRLLRTLTTVLSLRQSDDWRLHLYRRCLSSWRSEQPTHIYNLCVKRAETADVDSDQMTFPKSLSVTFDEVSRRLALELLRPSVETSQEVDSREDPEKSEEASPALSKLSGDSCARVVNLEENKRKAAVSLCRNVPASLSSIASEDDLRKYSLDSLRKLAKNEGLELGKTPSRERVLQELKQQLVASAMH